MTTYGGVFPYISVIDAPGSAYFTVKNVPSTAEVVVNASIGCMPMVLLMSLFAWVAGIIIWILVRNRVSVRQNNISCLCLCLCPCLCSCRCSCPCRCPCPFVCLCLLCFVSLSSLCLCLRPDSCVCVCLCLCVCVCLFIDLYHTNYF